MYFTESIKIDIPEFIIMCKDVVKNDMNDPFNTNFCFKEET